MKSKLDTRAYVSILKDLVEQGEEVNMYVLGSSMAPFVVHKRDVIYFKQPKRKLKKGDIAFFKRRNGQYVVHRIYKIKGDDYYFVGDNQTMIEGPIKRSQIFAIVTKVKRKDKIIKPGDFWWKFFSKVWIRIIPIRCLFVKGYKFIKKGSKKWNQ